MAKIGIVILVVLLLFFVAKLIPSVACMRARPLKVDGTYEGRFRLFYDQVGQLYVTIEQDLLIENDEGANEKGEKIAHVRNSRASPKEAKKRVAVNYLTRDQGRGM